MQERRYLLFVAVFSLSLLVSGCLCCGSPGYGEYVLNPQSEQECLEVNSNFARANCYHDLALLKEDASLCNKAARYDEMAGPMCFSDLSQMKNDIEICNMADSKRIKERCIVDFTAGENDPSGCDRIKNHFEMIFCYRNIAVRQENDSVCKKLDGKMQKIAEVVPFGGKVLKLSCITNDTICEIDMGEECRNAYQEFMDEVDGCESTISDYDHDSCIYGQALYASAPNLCKRARIQKERDRCLIMALADGRGSDDVKGCADIQDEWLMSECVTHAAEKLKDSKLCEIIPAESHKLYTTKYGDGTVRVYNSTYRGSCLENVAVATNDYSICPNIIESEKRSGCFLYIAENTKNISLCLQVPDGYMRSVCVSQFAQEKKDTGKCHVLENLSDVDTCLISYANRLKTPSVCDELSNKERIQNCQRVASG